MMDGFHDGIFMQDVRVKRLCDRPEKESLASRLWRECIKENRGEP